MAPEDARKTALHEAQTLRSFYDSATVLLGVVTLADDDIIHLSDNNATATFFGTTSEAMRGRSARAMGVPERYIRLWLEAYRASAASGEPVRFDYHHEGKGWLKVTVNTIGEGEGGRFCYVVDDITERKQAERALQRAHDELEARVRERTAELEADLRRAIGSGVLRLRYQPIVHLSDGRLKGFEVLVRWPHPKYGLLVPDAFIPLAEETGLILPLDRYVLATACRQLAAWRAAWPLADSLRLNVNVSSQHFMRPSFVADTLGTLAAHGLSPGHLNLEITETLLMQPAASAISAVEAIMASETGLCIDDFGTGYASLSYLQRFPACTLKIDRSFVQGLGASDKGTTLVQVIIAMAQTLGMRVVAEGVETEAQREQLTAFGCEAAQGYLFAAPLDETQATALLAADALPWGPSR